MNFPKLIKITDIQIGNIAYYKVIDPRSFQYALNTFQNVTLSLDSIPKSIDQVDISNSTDFGVNTAWDLDSYSEENFLNITNHKNEGKIPEIIVNNYYILNSVDSGRVNFTLGPISYSSLIPEILKDISNLSSNTNAVVRSLSSTDKSKEKPAIMGSPIPISPTKPKEPDLIASDIYDPQIPIDNPVIVPIPLKQSPRSYSELESYLKIGSVELEIPPQNLNIRKELKTENVEILRGSGTLKQIDRMDSYIIHIKLLFNTIDDINNNLSRLISQVRRTPFLPVRNYQLVSIYDIDAICIKEFSISTVPQFPNTLQVDIVAEPFNWRNYLPLQEGHFEDTFCWPLFNMWCYSRSDSKKLDTNFTGNISISVPDEQAIKQLLEVNGFVNKRLTGEKPTEYDVLGVKIPGFTDNQADLNTARLGLSSYELDQQTFQTASKLISSGKSGSFTSGSSPSSNSITEALPTSYVVKDKGEMKAVVKVQNVRTMLTTLALILKEQNPDQIKIYSEDQIRFKQPKGVVTDTQLEFGNELNLDQIKSLLISINVKNTSGNLVGDGNTSLLKYYIVIPQGSSIFRLMSLKFGKVDDQIKNNPDFFKEYKLSDETSITDVNIILTTKVVSHSKQQEEHPVHQCLGMGDSVVTLTGISKGISDIEKLKSIIDDVTSLSKFFRARPLDIDYYGYITIDNEILNLAGITSLIPVGITLSTIEGYPGLYSFNLQLIQYKNTQRSPEDLVNLNKILEIYAGQFNTGQKKENPIDNLTEKTNGNYVFKYDPRIRQSKHPLSKTPFDTKFDRLQRSILLNTTLRMFNLYPDLELPSKKELNYWIELLKYSSTTTNKVKSIAGQELISAALIGVNTEDSVGINDLSYSSLVSTLAPSKDILGFAEPDFYCIPANSVKELFTEAIDKLSGIQTIHKDSFGVRLPQDAYIKIDNYPEPNTDNPYYTSSDLKAAQEEERRLAEIDSKWGGTNPNTKASSDYENAGLGGTAYGALQQMQEDRNKSNQTDTKKTLINKDISTSILSDFSQVINPSHPIVGGVKTHSGSFSLLTVPTINFVREVLDIAKTNPQFFGTDPNISKILQEIDENVVYGLMARESDFGDLSGGGMTQIKFNTAKGLVSVNSDPGYKKFIAQIANKYDFKYNPILPEGFFAKNTTPLLSPEMLEGAKVSMTFGIAYLINCYLSNKSVSSLERTFKALAMYNGGPSNVDKAWKSIQKNGIADYRNTDQRDSIFLPGSKTENNANYALAVIELAEWSHRNNKADNILKNVDNQNLDNGLAESYLQTPTGENPEASKDYKDTPVIEEKVSYNPLSVFDELKKKDFLGRLVGAFPTYFVSIVDGGQFMGLESMWDHFYGRMGIVSIDITSNRKRPTDVAVVGFSNLYGKLTSTFADIENQKALNVNYRWGMTTIVDAFSQFLTPWLTDEYANRWKKFFDTLLVKPGARLHVRLGYGCTDEETEILTEEGWITYDKLNIGDKVLTLNHITGLSEWQPVKGINLYKVENEDLCLIDNSFHSSLTTLNHKWPVIKTKNKNKETSRKWRTSEELNTSDSIILSAKNNDLPKTKKWSDDLVEIIAWFWTEGHLVGKLKNSICISQSRKVNPENCKRIREALFSYFQSESSILGKGGDWYSEETRMKTLEILKNNNYNVNKTKKETGISHPTITRRYKEQNLQKDFYNKHQLKCSWLEKPRATSDETEFRLNVEASKLILEIAPNKVVSTKFIKELTQEQLDLFIYISELADGRDGTSIGQSDKKRLIPFELACILAGKRTHFYEKLNKSKNYLEHIVGFSDTKTMGFSHKCSRPTRVKYTGIVWCPTTENKSWCARRKGNVYFTGNSNASLLPVKFNGVITEVPTQDNVVEIVALGDGVELEKPMPIEALSSVYPGGEKQDAFVDSGWFGSAPRSPRQILLWLLGPKSNFIAQQSRGIFDDKNAYGINHFGQHDYNVTNNPNSEENTPRLFTVNAQQFSGETGENIYDGTQDPEQDDQIWRRYWDLFGFGWFGRDHTTMIGVQVENATPWNIVQTCRKSIPDFIAAVRPFEFRSTLFFGKAEFPYHNRYKTFYTPEDRETILKNSVNEALLPLKDIQESQNFSQLHLVLTGLNLLSGNIITNSENVYTNCMGKYYYDSLRPRTSGNSIQEYTTDLMQADIDIFEEVQKTKIVNTGIRTGSLQEAQIIKPGFVPDFVNTSAAMEVRDSIADMYEGYNMVMGDPTIFTWDYVYLMDANSLLHGMYQVKEVNSHFSTEVGYITLISPDAIVNIAGRTRPTFINTTAGIAKSLGSNFIITNAAARALTKNTPYITLGKLLAKAIDVPFKIGLPLSNKAIKLEKAMKKNRLVQGVINTPRAVDTGNTITLVKGFVTDVYKNITSAAGKRFAESEIKQRTANSLFSFYIEFIIKHHELIEKSSFFKKALTTVTKTKEISFEVAKASKGLFLNSTVQNNPLSNEIPSVEKTILEKLSSEIEAITKGTLTLEQVAVLDPYVTGAGKGVYRLVLNKALGAGESKVISGAVLNIAKIARGSNLLSLIAMVASTCLLGAITEMKNRYLQRRKCVVIYPLMIAGKEFSAGINGHMGSVAGDIPSHSDIFLKTMFDSTAAKNSGNLFFNMIGYALPILDFVLPGLDGAELSAGSRIENPFKNDMYDSVGYKSQEFNSFVNRLLGNNITGSTSIGIVTTGTSQIKAQPPVTGTTQKPDTTKVNIPRIGDNNNRVVYKGTGTPRTDKSILDDLNAIAKDNSWTIQLSSAERTPGHNASVHGKKHSYHLTADAVDISSINGIAVDSGSGGKILGDTLVEGLARLGYTTVRETNGRGRYIWQEEAHYNHIHVDSGERQ